MKQKQVKSQTKTAKQVKAKAFPPKKVQKVVEEDKDEEEVVEKIVVAKKPVKKNAGKGKKVVEIEVPSEEEEEDEEDQVDDEDLNGEDGEEASDDDNEEVAVEEDADEEVDGEENEAEDDDDEVEEDDDEVEEATISKEEPTIPSKVKTGVIPPSVPLTKIVTVTKLPNKCKKVDIVEAFAKYGAIDQIHMVTTLHGTVANIAFKTEKAAKAALAADKVLDSTISVKLKKERKEQNKDTVNKEKNSECVIFIRHLKIGTKEEDLKKHFESCGEIETVRVLTKYNLTYAFLTFKDKSSVPAAVKLHNSILNDQNISVLKNRNNNNAKDESRYDKDLTIIVRNNESFDKLDVVKLETIFSKCGEINLIDILCTKNILAFVTFKNDKAVKKALKLNGKTEQGIKLDLDVYNPTITKTGIYVYNLSKDCTEEDLRNVFSEAGEIAVINLKHGFAVIRFKDSDGYCKSFLYNEIMIKGQYIFIEPLSVIKKSVLSKNNFKKNGFKNKPFKRPAPNGNSVFSAKRAKTN